MGKWKGIFNTDKMTNRKVAMAIILIVVANSLGALGVFGLDLAAMKIASFSILGILTTVGLGWVFWGLNKKQI